MQIPQSLSPLPVSLTQFPRTSQIATFFTPQLDHFFSPRKDQLQHTKAITHRCEIVI